MAPALVLSAFLSLPAMQAQPSAVAAFQPHFTVKISPARTPARQLSGDDREIVCGMVVIHKTPADDPKILLPSRDTGAAVRRITPQGCAANSIPSAR